MSALAQYVIATSAAVTATGVLYGASQLRRLVETVESNHRKTRLHRAVLRRLTGRPLPESMTADEYLKHTPDTDANRES